MDWRAVCGGLFRGDFDCADSIGRGHRPHRNDHAAAERTGRRRLDSRAIHRDGEVLFDMPERNPGGQQRLLEGKGTAENEGDQIVVPRSEERRVGKEWVSTCKSRW